MVIKNIVFDIGNVVLSFKPKKFIKQYLTNEKSIESFVSKVTGSDTWLQLDRGTISIEKARRVLQTKFPKDIEFLTLFFDHWMEMLTPIQDTVELLPELKRKGYKLFALSNFIREAFAYVKDRYNFFSLFDGIVISSEIKAIKPEKKIYDTLIERYKLVPNECVYLDDVPSFLPPAAQMGVRTILYRPEIDVRAELRKHGVKI